MKKSESTAELSKAVAKFQGEVDNPKNTAVNPHFRSKYAPLNEVLNTITPILSKYGLSVIQNTSGDGDTVSITTLLLHESGEWLESDVLKLKCEKATPQGQGSAITYGRRYSLSALLGISSEDDDDGNHAENTADENKSYRGETANPASSFENRPATVGQPSELERRAAAVYYHFTGSREGQLGWSQEQYKSWLKEQHEAGHISSTYGKKWTEEDILWLEAQAEKLPLM